MLNSRPHGPATGLRIIALTRALCLVFLLAVCALPAQAVTVAAGPHHNLLLRDDGTVWAWGWNENGQLGDGTTIDRSAPVQVQGLSGVRSIAAGWRHSLAIKADGTLWAWGSNYYGQHGDGATVDRLTPVQVASGVQAVGAGLRHSLVVRTDGTLWASGWNSYGQLGDGTTVDRAIPVQVLSGVQAVAARWSDSLAIKTDGTLWTWGDNEYAQLGDGTTVNRAAPVPVLSGVRAVAGGLDHALALKTDGTVWAWGQNFWGEVGDGTTINRPAPVPVLSGVQSIAAGRDHSLAIKTDGTLWAWGFNGYGAVGDGVPLPGINVNRTAPVQVMSGVQAVTAGDMYSLAVKTDGTLFAWGNSAYGVLGDATTVSRSVPTAVLSGARMIAGGGTHSLAVKTDGTLWTWGYNSAGELGDGTTVDRPVPVQVMSGVQAAAGGSSHSLAVRNDGNVWSWGLNYAGQLGDGTTAARYAPAPVMDGARAVAAGSAHSLALKADGTAWAWGSNHYGQLVDGTTVDRLTPVQVLSGVRAIAAGWGHSLVVKTDGTLWASGWNNYGQLGDGTTADRATPVPALGGVQAVAAGTYHSLALKSDGTLWAWGANFFGQLGDGTDVDRATPMQVSNGVQAIAAGSTYSLVLKTDGTLWSWGALPTLGSSWGVQPLQNPFLRNVSAIAAGGNHALALTVDGRVLAWGNNSYQQLGIPRLTMTSTPLAVRDPLTPYAGADVVVEYFNPTIGNGAGTPGIGHYFITAAGAEATSIDAGGSGPGWARTGRTFRAWNDSAKAPAGAVGVCRFYARVPNSHFYTANAAECQSLKDLNPTNDANLGWRYEGLAFYTVVPTGGSCGAGYHSVYRSYNNRFNLDPVLNDGNHRITSSYNDYQRSIRFFGYVDEGIAFCSPASPNPGGDLQATYSYPGATVQAGSPVSVEFLFGNNGAGKGDGGSIYMALPAEVSNWSVACTARNGATCPSSSDLTSLREGSTITTWPAGGTLSFMANGTAPHVTTGSGATLKFVATVANASGSPDINPANDTPPMMQTVVKATAVCNTVPNPTALTLGPAAQTPHVSLIIGDGCAWTAQSNTPWLTVIPVSGAGDATLTLALADNATISPRSGGVTINGTTIQVTQSGVACSYAMVPGTLTFTASVQSGSLSVTAPAGCSWTAQSSSPWLSASPVAGSGSGTLTVSLQANAAAIARTAGITVGGQTILVTQFGTACAYGANPATLGLSAAQQASTVILTVPQGCAWTAQSNVPWLVATPASGNGNGTLTLTVESNPTAAARSGSVSVGSQAILITQAGATCRYTMTPTNVTLTAGAQTSTMNLSAPPGCTWTAQSGETWLTVTPANGTGSGTVTLAVQANPAATARTGNIAVGTELALVVQSGQTEAAPPPTATDPCATMRLQRGGDQIAPAGLTGALSFDVIADGGCAWRARSNAPWITLTAGSGGNGSGTVSYLVEPNNDLQARNGSLAVGARTFAINQLGSGAIDQNGGGGSDGGGDGGGGAGSGGAGAGG